MLCPSDRAEMHQVKIVSHYGQPIFVDQCEKCGGIWFDESELFRAKQGEAEKIEVLNTEILRTPSAIENSTLFCPRDQTAMRQFTDKYFPQDIILVRCPSCRGIWLNRGIFTRYQQFRQGLMRTQKSPQDEKMKENIAQWEAAYRSRRSTGTLARLEEFLSPPLGSGYYPDFRYTPDVDDVAGVGNIVVSALGILLTIIRLILRF